MSKRLIDLTEEDLDAREERLVQRIVETLGAGEGPRLLDRDSIARALATSTRTVDRLRREGMPELRIGDAPRFDMGEVVAWLRSRRGALRLVGGSSAAR